MPRVLLPPVAMDLLGREDVVERHDAGDVGMLYVTGQDKELFAQRISVEVRDDIVLVIEKGTHQPAVVGVQEPEPLVTGHRQRVEPLVCELFVLRIQKSLFILRCLTSGNEGLLHG